MKKFFIMGMAAMGLVLTACNNDETVEVAKGNAIGFSSFVDKSTRLNSSHTVISYAVFCLKKKKN